MGSGRGTATQDTGGPRHRRSLRYATLSGGLLLLIILALPGLVPAQERVPDLRAAPEVPPAPPAEVLSPRDSLMQEIRFHTELIRGLRDSLALDIPGGLQISPERREALQKNIDDISQVIEQIGAELSDLEFEIKENRISLLNEAGEGIVIDIPESLPENLDETFSEGFRTLTQVILQELPDSVEFDPGRKVEWRSFIPGLNQPEPRRIVHGNQVRVHEDLLVPEDEDVRGNVVVAFGDLEIAGRVEGDVVNLFGTLVLAATAEVTGQVIGVGGRIEEDPGADVGEVHGLDLLDEGNQWSIPGLMKRGLLVFLVAQGLFLMTVLLTVVAVAAAPASRFSAVVAQIRGSAVPSFGVGMLASLPGLPLIVLVQVVLVLSFVGIPVAMLVAGLLAAVTVVSLAVTGSVVGERLCRHLGGRCRQPWMVAVVGLAALDLVFFVGTLLNVVDGSGVLGPLVMVLGLTILLVAQIVGTGALVITRLGGRSPES